MKFLRWVAKLLMFLTFFDVLLMSLAETSSLMEPVCAEGDREALLSFKSKITKDTTGILSSWTGKDCCNGDWEGVECNPTTGRVISLQLQGPVKDDSIFMVGTLSPSLDNLRFLEAMVISGMKHITGPIPDSFSNLTKLTQLVLEDNALVGGIPSGFGRLSLLNAFSLSGNRLKGQIPPSLGNLQNVQQINLGRNFLVGAIPLTFKNLHGLMYLDMSFNLLSGAIPDIMGQFKNISFIDLSHNRLTGKLPTSLFGLPNLLDLSLAHNQLTGTIPDRISDLKSLTTLTLSENGLTGPIPASLSTLKNLWYLNLSRNGFSDPLPSALAKGIPSLLSMDLSYNNLSLGTVPEWILNRKLSEVHLAGCKIRGPIPIFRKSESLSSIDLSDNYLEGGIPIIFFKNMSSLQKIKVSNNKLKFDLSQIPLPEGISFLDFSSNQITGALSRIFNNRTGKFLEHLDASNNQISGSIPEFSEGMRLRVLNIGSNRIAGHIPSSVSSLVELERLDVSRNHLVGTIPTSLGLLVKLQWLDLSINALAGKIPISLLGIERLKHANFRANRLCGEIPQGRPYNIFPAAAYAHNLCLCGRPLPPCRVKQQEKLGQ